MIVRFNPRPEDLQRLQVGPIGPHLQSFATLVAQQGYCSVTGWLKVRFVARLSRWLEQHRVPISGLNETQIAAFFNARWKRLKRHRQGDLKPDTSDRAIHFLVNANRYLPDSVNGTKLIARFTHKLVRWLAKK